MEATKEMKFGTKVAYGMRMMPSNTRIAQRKCAIPHLTMKSNRNIIECAVITLTRGCQILTSKRALALRTSVTAVLLVTA